MKHVADNVFSVSSYMGYLNMYVIDTGAGLAVVDAGLNKSSVDRLERAFKDSIYRFEDIRYILITHFHNDHTGGLAELQSRVDAPTYAHVLEAPYIRGERAPIYAHPSELNGLSRQIHRYLPKKLTPARVDVEVQHEEMLNRVLPGLQVVHLPGHSPGQVGYFLTESRILIGGDVMMSFPTGLRMPLRAATFAWEQAKESIQRVADMDVLVLCLGHGRPRLGNADIPVERLVKRLG
jgi:glyoxylase-like metal-dependent hydrolase (beta-lactamase superfamily II)